MVPQIDQVVRRKRAQRACDQTVELRRMIEDKLTISGLERYGRPIKLSVRQLSGNCTFDLENRLVCNRERCAAIALTWCGNVLLVEQAKLWRLHDAGRRRTCDRILVWQRTRRLRHSRRRRDQ